MADQHQISYYREIVEKENSPVIWREININTGLSTTQKDVKFPDLAGGYAYKDSSRFYSSTRNRFICWRTSDNVIELSEVSLDFNLQGRHLRIRFSDAPVICGVRFFETPAHIVILACTASSAHRLLFHHPKSRHAQDVFQLGFEASLPSIFADVSNQLAHSPANLHNINVGGTHTVYVAHTGAMHLTSDGEAMFAMAIQNGGILVVKLPPVGTHGVAVQHEIVQASVVSRFLGGFMQSIIGGQENSQVTSVSFHANINNVMIFAVSKDSKLRIWSASTYEFLGAVDLLEHVPDLVDQSSKVLGGTGHIIKMSACTVDQSVYMAVYLSFANKCQFVIYHLTSESKKYQPTHVATLFGIEGNLVDFYVTPSHLWTLWTLRSGETTVRYAVIDGQKRREWLDVLLCSQERLELDVNQPLDPREIYMNYIFHPGRFSTDVILKALKIYRRSTDASHAETPSSIPISILKSEVCQAVEAEIREAVGDEEMAEEEFVQLQRQLWSKFYSGCVQYHERGMKPVGIFSDEVNGMIGLVKKAGMSFLYGCPSLDQMYLGGVSPNDYEFSRDHPGPNSAGIDVTDLALLGRCLKVIRGTIDEETAIAFQNGVGNGSNPLDLVEMSVRSLQTVAREDVLRELHMKLQKLQDVFGSIESLVELLDISLVGSGSPTDEVMPDDAVYFGMSHVFASTIGVAIVSEVFRQTMLTRFEMCRDLLVLVKLLPRVVDQGLLSRFGVKLNDTGFQLGCLVRSYNLLRWCSESMAIQEATSSLESSRKQLETLNLLRPLNYSVSKRLGDGQQLTLVEAFISADGGSRVREQLMSTIQPDQEICSYWKQVLLPVVVMTARLIWPTVPDFVFPQSLMALGQHLAVQGYVRLLHDWCNIDTSSRRFILGLSFLSSNEPYKALDCFLSAAQDVMAEEFLIRFMTNVSSDALHYEVQYYLQVINLFEEFDFPHLVVRLAKLAIAVAEPDDLNVPTLWSKVFKNELEMGHNSEAYKALMGNPDTARGKDCLRQFLVVLCERNELSSLVDLSYRDSRNNLEPEVERILDSRAKSVELTKQNYYDMLYAFHVKRNNYRKAGSVMYEFGMRLRREVNGLKGLQQQAKCYLACMNVLKLGDPKYAWVLKPVARTNEVSRMEESEAETDSPRKRARTEENLQDLLKLKQRRVEVLGLEDIRKEYVLVHAHLTLLKSMPQASQLARPSLRPDETVGLLANAGMFDLAIELCQIFNLPMTPVFEGLLLKCIWLSRGGTPQATVFENQHTSDTWSWLQYNDSGTMSPETGGAADIAWRLLELYLEKYEEKSTRYHKCVAAKALHQGFDLPSWFLTSYKKTNAAELLRLYLSYGFLEESTELAIEYIQATMGRGKEYFGLDDYLHAGSAPVWLPYTCLDQLLHALDDAKGKDKHFAELHHQLTKTLDNYFSVVQNATDAALVMLRGH